MSTTTHLSETKRKLLEMYLHGNCGANLAGLSRITRRANGNPPPLSLAQEQIWFCLQEPRDLPPPVYNESITIHRSGPLDFEVLERCLAEIIRRHEIWRTTVDTLDGQPVQIIHPAPATYHLPAEDLRALPDCDREAEAIRLATQDARLPFDLCRGPLVRAMLVTLSKEEHRLFLTMHQMIVDGVSVYRVLPSELAALYEAFSDGEPSPLPDPTIQYADFACWQRQWLRGETLHRQLAYWSRQLASVPVLQWPNVRPRPRYQTFRGAIRASTISPSLSEALRMLSLQEGVTLFMTLLAGFVALLHSYTKQEDIVVGTVAPAGRDRPEILDLIGNFLNPIPLRTNLSDVATFRELLQRTRDVVSGALAHDDIPFHYLVNHLQPPPDASRNPFFQVAISLAPPMPRLARGWNQTPMDVESGGARWDLYLELSDRPSGLLVRTQYNPDLFGVSSIESMLQDLQQLLEAVAANPQRRLSDLPL